MKNFNEKLEKLKDHNKNPFSTPEGYFEDLPTRIQDRIISENKEYNWVIRLFSYIKPQFALGFMIVAFAAIAYTTTTFILSDQRNAIETDLYTRTIEVDPSEFTEQHFIDVLLEDEKKIEEQKKEETDLYIHYLVDEDIDYGTLIDEL